MTHTTVTFHRQSTTSYVWEMLPHGQHIRRSKHESEFDFLKTGRPVASGWHYFRAFSLCFEVFSWGYVGLPVVPRISRKVVITEKQYFMSISTRVLRKLDLVNPGVNVNSVPISNRLLYQAHGLAPMSGANVNSVPISNRFLHQAHGLSPMSNLH